MTRDEKIANDAYEVILCQVRDKHAQAVLKKAALHGTCWGDRKLCKVLTRFKLATIKQWLASDDYVLYEPTGLGTKIGIMLYDRNPRTD